MRISPEQKLIVAAFSDEVFRGRTVRQEMPRCCDSMIDLYKTPVRFLDVQVGSRIITLFEPRCPECGRWVKPVYSILQ
jgi:hypothetical protein